MLGADPEFREPTEHPIRIWNAVHSLEPCAPGSVRVRAGQPLRLLAAVHDLSADPTWTEAWIAAALAGILRETERRELGRLGLPVLGAVHGRLPPERFLRLLDAALADRPPRHLERLWLIPPPRVAEELDRLLAGARDHG